MRIKGYLMAVVSLVLLAVSPMALTGCALLGGDGERPVITSPTSSDFSFEQNVSVVLQAYGKAALQAADLVEAPDTPTQVKTILASAVLNTEAPALAVNDALRLYTEAQAVVDEAKASGEPISQTALGLASSRYGELQSLWVKHKTSLQNFPGLVQGAAEIADRDFPDRIPEGGQIP